AEEAALLSAMVAEANRPGGEAQRPENRASEPSDQPSGARVSPPISPYPASAPTTGGRVAAEYGRAPRAPFNASVPAFGAGVRPGPESAHSDADAIAARAVASQDAELQAVARAMGFA